MKYVFADKTGTITKNSLTFKKCWMPCPGGGGGGLELSPGDPNTLSPPRRNLQKEGSGATVDLFLAISVCHTVVPHRDDEGKE